MHIGIQAKGVLAMRIEVSGKAAHGSTRRLGDNAVLKALDVFRAIEGLPFARESSDLFDRPSINLGRILGGDALNKVPIFCAIDVDIRYLPGQDPVDIMAEVEDIPDTVVKVFQRGPDRRAKTSTCRLSVRPSPAWRRQRASASAWAATAPRTRSRSWTPGCRRWSAGPPARATTGRRSGFRSGRWASIGRLWWSPSSSSASLRRGRSPAQDRLMYFDNIPKPGLWKRLLLGAVLVIFASAAATAVAAFNEVDKVVDALKLGPELKLREGTLARRTPVSHDAPDPRLGPAAEEQRGGSRSTTPARTRSCSSASARRKEATAIMSLPRDLKVEIPGHGVDKINAAYSIGGPQKALETVKQLTGISINHMINVSFKGFWRAVNAIDCVYADVDRDYYNDSAEFSTSTSTLAISGSARARRCSTCATGTPTPTSSARPASETSYARPSSRSRPPS